MNDELVTAAVFGDHTQAVVARNHLDEAGIPAFLLDEWMSQGLFVLGGAVGGVRIQVPKSRLDEAIRLINDRLPEHGAEVNWSEVDVGQPEADSPVNDEEFPADARAEPAMTVQAPSEEIDPPDMTLREQRANRIVRGTVIGLFAWPVFLFAMWRLIQIASSTERLRPKFQRKANIAAVIIGVTCLLILSWWCFVPLVWFTR